MGINLKLYCNYKSLSGLPSEPTHKFFLKQVRSHFQVVYDTVLLFPGMYSCQTVRVEYGFTFDERYIVLLLIYILNHSLSGILWIENFAQIFLKVLK